jgi:branched-subunit amino acid transport protein
VSAAWVVVLAVGAATVLLKATGPVFLGGRTLPPRVVALVDVLAPVMLAALVVTQAVGGDEELVLDGARLAGLAAGGAAVALRAPLLVVIAAAAAAAALLRLAT